MKEKRILLTTLGSTGNNRLDYKYFYYDRNGWFNYCNSLSIAEAGTKYILSKENIDEIIVLGSGATYNNEDVLRPLVLRNFADYSAEGIENLSEYSFFRYRIAQFMEGVDVEEADLDDSISPDREAAILKVFREICEQARHITDLNFTQKKAFHLINKTPELQSILEERTEGFSGQEKRWLMHYLFVNLDSSFKVHALEYNEKIQMCFVPIVRTRDSMLPMDNILAIAQEIISGDPDRIHLFMDMQGIGSVDGYTLISVFSMLANDATNQLSIRGLITTHSLPSRIASPIDDKAMKRYDLNQLVSGMNAFLKYGKVDLIREYWYSRNIHQPRIELLLYGMQNVADGISLCDLETMEYGIRILKKVFSGPEVDDMPELESNIFLLIAHTIWMDYGKLVSEEEITGIELIKWAYRKKLYQQTLTIIESKIPLEFVQKGILYYAKDEETRLHMLESLQLCYENSHPSQRWGFKDPDHYFIKFYGRSHVRSSSSATDRTRDYVALRIRELSEDHEDLVKAYSVLEGQKPLLMKLLNAYYNVGTVRNAVNHAEERADVYSLENIDVRAENENLSMLQNAIEDFIHVYEQVLNELEHLPAAEPVRISGEEFQTWSMEQSRGNRGKWYSAGNQNGHGSRDRDESADRNGSRERNESRERNGSRERNESRNRNGSWDRNGSRDRDEGEDRNGSRGKVPGQATQAAHHRKRWYHRRKKAENDYTSQ